VIWREVALAKKAKPVIVSMGDVAASGGYYISCAADAIVAHPNTITGSIGVFGVVPNAKGLLDDKLGITVDTVNTNKHADIMSPYRAVAKDESEIIQHWIENVYTDFITKVGDGRKMKPAEVDSIGQGRVWSGIDGKRIGLVDEFGGMKDAIALAAKKANLKTYELLELPKMKDPFEELFGNILDEEETQSAFGQFSLLAKYFLSVIGGQWSTITATNNEQLATINKQLTTILRYQGIQMRLPYDVVVY
jgi:protease-4